MTFPFFLILGTNLVLPSAPTEGFLTAGAVLLELVAAVGLLPNCRRAGPAGVVGVGEAEAEV